MGQTPLRCQLSNASVVSAGIYEWRIFMLLLAARYLVTMGIERCHSGSDPRPMGPKADIETRTLTATVDWGQVWYHKYWSRVFPKRG